MGRNLLQRFLMTSSHTPYTASPDNNNESLTVSSLNVSSHTDHDTHDTIKVYDWIWDPSLNPPRYVSSKNTNSGTTTVVELNMDPYQLTTYSVGDFVLREYLPTKAGKEYPTSTVPVGGDRMK